MTVSEQVEMLRNVSDAYMENGAGILLLEAANTIEALFSKLTIADDKGWIYCGDGNNLPEEHSSMFAKLKGTDRWSDAMFEKASSEVNATIEFEDGKRAVKTLHTIDGRWNEDRKSVV